MKFFYFRKQEVKEVRETASSRRHSELPGLPEPLHSADFVHTVDLSYIVFAT